MKLRAAEAKHIMKSEYKPDELVQEQRLQDYNESHQAEGNNYSDVQWKEEQNDEALQGESKIIENAGKWQAKRVHSVEHNGISNNARGYQWT